MALRVGLAVSFPSLVMACGQPPETSVRVLPAGPQTSLVLLLLHSAHTEKTVGQAVCLLGMFQKEQSPQYQAGLYALVDIWE